MNDIYHPTIMKHDTQKTAICIYMDDIGVDGVWYKNVQWVVTTISKTAI
jgi:hypothetical protein